MSSAICLNLHQSIILSSGNELNRSTRRCYTPSIKALSLPALEKNLNIFLFSCFVQTCETPPPPPPGRASYEET